MNITVQSQSLEEGRRGTESTLLEVQCKVSTVSDGLGYHICCALLCMHARTQCWSTVFSEVQGQHIVYQEVLEHSPLFLQTLGLDCC